MSANVLTISPTGQIALPETLLQVLAVGCGDSLAAYAVGDTLVLKPVRQPSPESFKAWMDDAQRWAQSVGYREEDVADIVKDVRRRKRAGGSSSTPTS